MAQTTHPNQKDNPLPNHPEIAPNQPEIDPELREKARRAFVDGFAEGAASIPPPRPEEGAVTVGSVSRGIRDRFVWIARAAIRGRIEGYYKAFSVLYDGDPTGALLGTPEQAKAWRALHEGDPEHFVRVFGQAGKDALQDNVISQMVGAPLPVDALVARANAVTDPDTGLPEMTSSQLDRWRKAWAQAAIETGKSYVDFDEEDQSPEAAAIRTLSPDERLVLFAQDAAPRGFAEGDPSASRDIEAIRLRVRRQASREKASDGE